ncbi:hypothetical protein [Intrasporangium sp.]|uniref:hypothetical protein n=1 Tax=Intrasporangium sp. TaxID=1925024 RepID=UPI00293B0F66|nr:hypothetical protein [Intrasporangium sp.]MDV3221745.1 hypothetical protein [Intrasporangium sp.]
MSPNELDLRQTLQEDAARIDATGDFATAAIGLERRRTRRRTTITAAAAAVAAAVVPFLFWSPTGPTGSLAPATTPSPSASASPTPSATASGAETTTPTVTTTPPAPPVTATPENTYALDDTIVVAGRKIPLERGTVVESLVVLSNGGFLLQSHMSTGASQSEMEILDADGRTVAALGDSGFYAVSRDGTRVLYRNGLDDTVRVAGADGDPIAERRDDRSPAAIVGDYAYLNADASQPGLEWNYVTGETREVPSHIVAVSDDRTRAALQWELPSDGQEPGCWAIVDLTQQAFPTLVEQCGPEGNPTHFQPSSFSSTGTYLIGSKFIDGGHWFIPGVFRASDGRDMLGGTPEKPISAWSWRLDADEQSLVISRNTAADVFGGEPRNTLQRCTLGMDCTTLQPELELTDPLGMSPRYVVPR